MQTSLFFLHVLCEEQRTNFFTLTFRRLEMLHVDSVVEQLGTAVCRLNNTNACDVSACMCF